MFLFYDIYIYTRRLFVFKCCAVAALGGSVATVLEEQLVPLVLT